jgi:benzylsuccinate CoA-transferase BbsF subunit
VLAGWVAPRNAAETAIELQAHRIAAHEVASSASAWRDPQLRERGHWVAHVHTRQGDTLVEGPRWRLSRTPPAVAGPAPCLGEHTFEVLTEVLGYDADRIAELAAAEALG